MLELEVDTTKIETIYSNLHPTVTSMDTLKDYLGLSSLVVPGSPCCVHCSRPVYENRLCLVHFAVHCQQNYRRSVRLYVLSTDRRYVTLSTEGGYFDPRVDLSVEETVCRTVLDSSNQPRFESVDLTATTIYRGRITTHVVLHTDQTFPGRPVQPSSTVSSWILQYHLTGDTSIVPAGLRLESLRNGKYVRIHDERVVLLPYQMKVLEDPFLFQRSWQDCCEWVRQNFSVYYIPRGTVLYHLTEETFQNFRAETFFALDPELCLQMFEGTNRNSELYASIVTRDVHFLDFACHDDETSVFGKELVRLVLGRRFWLRHDRARETRGRVAMSDYELLHRVSAENVQQYDDRYRRFLRHQRGLNGYSLSDVVHHLNHRRRGTDAPQLDGWCAVDRLDSYFPAPGSRSFTRSHSLETRTRDVHRRWSREFNVTNPNCIRPILFDTRWRDWNPRVIGIQYYHAYLLRRLLYLRHMDRLEQQELHGRQQEWVKTEMVPMQQYSRLTPGTFEWSDVVDPGVRDQIVQEFQQSTEDRLDDHYAYTLRKHHRGTYARQAWPTYTPDPDLWTAGLSYLVRELDRFCPGMPARVLSQDSGHVPVNLQRNPALLALYYPPASDMGLYLLFRFTFPSHPYGAHMYYDHLLEKWGSIYTLGQDTNVITIGRAHSRVAVIIQNHQDIRDVSAFLAHLVNAVHVLLIATHDGPIEVSPEHRLVSHNLQLQSLSIFFPFVTHIHGAGPEQVLCKDCPNLAHIDLGLPSVQNQQQFSVLNCPNLRPSAGIRGP